ncbi:MAG: hypothetical protein MK132_02250 [Lentisphaerales bacterium]|nr:hypothetical protein [Lentisphaerales bacterium]
MKKILIVLMIVLAVTIGGGMYAWNKVKGAYKEAVNTVKGGEISKPNLENWGELKKGMTVEEAQELLGNSIIYTFTENEVATTYLIYTHSDGILSQPSDKSHNLEFDSDGKLVKWNEPKVEVKTEIISVEK